MSGQYILRKGRAHYSDLVNDFEPIAPLFVDTFVSGSGNGSSWAQAFKTMTEALSAVQTGGKIYFRGKVAEECIGSNLKFDVSIIGVGSLHHFDQPTSAYHGGASVWQAPASPTAATPLLKVRGRGWKFENILFDCPVDSAAVYLERNALSDVSEYDASHASFYNCDFRNGLYGIQDVGGCFNVKVENCTFETLDATTSGTGIICTSTAVANPRRLQVLSCFFQADSTTEGNERHIVGAYVGSLIKGSVFGTVKGTGKYIDLTGGSGNIVFGNLLMGAYDTGDYVGGTGDSWAGNQSLSASFGGNDAQGRTLTAPAAAT